MVSIIYSSMRQLFGLSTSNGFIFSLNSIAVCIGVVGGVNSVFSTMLAIAVLSMLMLALRAALYPIHVSVAADDSVGLEQLEENEVESRVNPQ